MRNLLAAGLTASTLLGLAAGCRSAGTDDPTPCPATEVALTAIPHWASNPYCFGPPVEQAGQFQSYVINSDAELLAVNRCPDSLRIDFKRYTLLVGKTKTVACNYVAAQRVEQTCEGLVYHVVVGPGACQAPSEAVYGTLIPKQPADARISFDVQVRR